MEARTPALLPNILWLAAENGKSTSLINRVMVMQWEKSISVECGPVEKPWAALMFFPISDEEFEMMSLFSPIAAKHMLSLVRYGQLTVKKIAQDTGCAITTMVRPNSVGERLARWLGFIDHEVRGITKRMIYHG